MSIHDFHSKLVSGKEEGMFIEGLRRLRSIARPMASDGTMEGWSYWTEGEGGSDGATAEPGWGEALSRA